MLVLERLFIFYSALRHYEFDDVRAKSKIVFLRLSTCDVKIVINRYPSRPLSLKSPISKGPAKGTKALKVLNSWFSTAHDTIELTCHAKSPGQPLHRFPER